MEKIIKEIAHKIVSNENFNNYGLLTGYIGQMIFLYEYAKVDSSYSRIVPVYLDRFYADIEQGIVLPSYSRGISGACLGIAYVSDNKSLSFVSKSIDEYLECEANLYLNNRDFDFLHGSIGIGLYFVERYKDGSKIAKNILKNILIALDKNKVIVDNSRITWQNFNNISDISISHGISAIIIFLCQLVSIGFEYKNLPINLLQKANNYILSQEIDKAKYNSYFPYTSDQEQIKGSRLAWCYGDLGISIALLKSSDILKNKQLETKAFEVLLYNTTRKNLKENLVDNDGLCHGSSGISLIYNYVNKKYTSDAFLQCEKFWIDQTIQIYLENKNTKELNMLEGISGTGLVLLNSLYDTGTEWSKFLLI